MTFSFSRDSKYDENSAVSVLRLISTFFAEWSANELINCVYVSPYIAADQSTFAFITTNVFFNKLQINLYLRDSLIDKLIDDPNDAEAKHILKHECGHCIDAHNLFSILKILPQKEFDYNASRSVIVRNIGLYCWGEYFAHRFSYDGVFFRSQYRTISSKAKKCGAQLRALNDLMQDDCSRTGRIDKYRIVYGNISGFIYDVINLLADYHSSNKCLYADKVALLVDFDKSGFFRFGNWIIEVGYVLSRMYMSYPTNMSMQRIENIGNTIFTLFENFSVQLIEDEDGTVYFEVIPIPNLDF